MSEVLHIRREGHILEVILDRPPANAIDHPTSRLMGKTFQAFRDDPSLRVAIIATAGDRFFSAGWDLKAAAEGALVDEDYGVGGFGGATGGFGALFRGLAFHAGLSATSSEGHGCWILRRHACSSNMPFLGPMRSGS